MALGMHVLRMIAQRSASAIDHRQDGRFVNALADCMTEESPGFHSSKKLPPTLSRSIDSMMWCSMATGPCG